MPQLAIDYSLISQKGKLRNVYINDAMWQQMKIYSRLHHISISHLVRIFFLDILAQEKEKARREGRDTTPYEIKKPIHSL